VANFSPKKSYGCSFEFLSAVVPYLSAMTRSSTWNMEPAVPGDVPEAGGHSSGIYVASVPGEQANVSPVSL
jgi:hypothetical protein